MERTICGINLRLWLFLQNPHATIKLRNTVVVRINKIHEVLCFVMDSGGVNMCTKSELNSILQKLIQIYRSVYGENLVQVILYGSYARGDYNTDSDVDIVAIVHGKRKILQQQLKKVWDFSCDLELEYDTILSPTVIPYEEFEQYRMDLPYYRNISQEGVVISA